MKTRKIHYIAHYKYAVISWLLIVVLYLFSACTAINDDSLDNKDSVIRFSSVTVSKSEVSTRAVVMGADAHNEGLPIGSDIDVFIYNVNKGSVPSDDEENDDPAVTLPMVYTTTEAPDAETAQSSLNIKNSTVKPPKYPNVNGNKNAYIFAVWPAKATEDETNEDSYSFSVNTNQSIPANVTASDLMATDQIIQSSDGGKAINLPMTHCMAKVIVKFNPTGSLTDSNMPTTFSVLGVKNTVTIKPKTAATDATDNGRAAITTNNTTVDITASPSEAFLLPPQTIDANSPFLQFTISGVTADHFADIENVTFKLPTALTLVANTVYEITVNVNVNYITVTATITPWNSETMTFDKYIL